MDRDSRQEVYYHSDEEGFHSQSSFQSQNHNLKDNQDGSNSIHSDNSSNSSNSNNSKTKKTKKIHKQKKNQTRKDGQRFIGDQVKQNFTIEQDLRMVFITFFSIIEQPHGIVFQADTRKRLKLMHNIVFTDQVTYEPQVQSRKIQNSINKLQIMKSVISNKAATAQLQAKLHSLYSQPSFIFCPQSTSQLYNIFTTIINILSSPLEQTKIQKQLRLFGDRICSSINNQFFFFGFRFIDSTKTLTKKTYILEQKDKIRYTLKEQYRQPNGKYADMVVKCAEIIKRELQLLSCARFIGMQ